MKPQSENKESEAIQPSRREVLAGAASFAAASMIPKTAALPEARSSAGSPFLNILREPELARVFVQPDMHAKPVLLRTSSSGGWEANGTTVRLELIGEKLSVLVRSEGDLSRIHLRWEGDLGAAELFLGDEWERNYGTLEWRSESANRVMPWYCMVHEKNRTHGYGVETSPNAFCFWMADRKGVSLWIDVRNGGSPVKLRDRELEACRVVCREGKEGESSYAATRAFCQMMCPKPRPLAKPVVGTNDWYYAYGNNDPEMVVTAADVLMSLAQGSSAELVTVIDAGWSVRGIERGPWIGNEKFGDMGKVAGRLKALGVTPGLWFRPLAPETGGNESLRFKNDPTVYDPSIPEALELVAADVRRFREWGYDVIKHDFSGTDILGRFGFLMGASLTKDNWKFNNTSLTSAEIVTQFYNALRVAAGDARLIGCNTYSHLSAGVFEMNRIGDDVSGHSWDRTRRMGVNSLAFRSAQNGTFYAADPDVAPISDAIPWELSEKWLRLVSLSGMPLFISASSKALGTREKAALRKAIAAASELQPPAEPLDWLQTQCPRSWKLGGSSQTFEWMTETGGWPWTDTYGEE